MAVTTTKTNKPFNPRAQDQSPKGYNRAKLYSGKALDFDGVNDYVAIAYDASTRPTSEITLTAIAKMDWSSSTQTRILSCTEAGGYNISVGEGSFIPTGNTGMLLRLSSSGYTAVYISNTTIPDGYNAISSTFDGRYLKLYLNGTLVATTDSGETQSIYYAYNNSLFVGAEASSGATPAGSGYWNGEISNAKIFNTALTAAQVADLYNNPEKVVPTGVDNTALKLWLPMMEGAGTTAINGAPDALGSELITNGDFSDGTNDWIFGSAFSVVNGKAYYNDSASGNQIYQSNLTFSESKNYILTFDISDATDAVIWVGNGAGSNAYTINANYHTYNNGHYSLFLRGSDIGASETTLGIWANPSGAAFSIDNISLKEVANCGTISGATWTHGIGSPVAQTSVIDWNKWKLEGGSSTNEYLIPQGLTAGRDLLGNLFENVRKQGALNLDGNSWGKVHPNNSFAFGTGAFSMEAWAKLEYVNTGSYANEIMALNDSDSWAIKTVIGEISFIAGVGVSLYHTKTLDNSWAHIVGVRNADGSMKLYINGVEEESNAAGSSTASVPIANPVRLGTDNTEGTRAYKDDIAQPRIYNRALTAEEVQRSYDSGKNIYTNS